jgi:hypothetical protein
METLELPVVEEPEEVSPLNFTGRAIDLAAFKLWREASRIDLHADGEESA